MIHLRIHICMEFKKIMMIKIFIMENLTIIFKLLLKVQTNQALLLKNHFNQIN
jgi:hypothetical protein